MIAVSDYEMEIIQNIIKKHATDCTVLAFGSRYKWTNKDYSDLDLAFVKPNGEKVGHSSIFDIKEEFEESDLPFKVDVLDYHAVSPEFKAIIDAGNTVIYETPQANLNWKVVRAEEVIDFNPRETIKKGSISKKIAMEQLQPFTRDILSYESAEFKNGTKFRNGDTLMARITPCLENGKTAKVNLLDKDEIAFGSTEYIVMRAKKGITDEDYIYYLSISSFWREMAIKSMVGSSGRQRVQLDVLKSTEILLPSLEVQRKIAKTLKVLDDKIENNKKINQNLEEMAQAIFKSWFIDFEPWDGVMPKDWKIANLMGIANYLNGLAMQKFRLVDNEIGLPVLKIKELRQGFTDKSSDLCSPTIKPEYIIDNGDVVFSWSGSLLVDLWCGGKAGLNQHLFKVTSEKYDKWFYFSWTKYYLQEFISIAADKAPTKGHIKREHLTNAKVLIPSSEDYVKIGEMLKPIYGEIINNKIEIQRLVELRYELLANLISKNLYQNFS